MMLGVKEPYVVLSNLTIIKLCFQILGLMLNILILF